VFGGVQFAIAVMRLAEDPAGPRRGWRAPSAGLTPIRVAVTAGRPQPRRPSD
jgi:hypothetical protein